MNGGRSEECNHITEDRIDIEAFGSQEVSRGVVQRLQEQLRQNAMPRVEAENPAQQLVSSCRRTFDLCLDILSKKNHDYAEDVDAFANFRTCEMLGISVEKGIMVRWLDKLKRIDNLLEKEAYVTEESIEDTLRDAINYPAILLAYLQHKKACAKACSK